MRDSFGREITCLRLSVTDRCGLRCRYCVPAEGVCGLPRDRRMTEDEMIAAVEAAASIGIRRVRITGGEPLTERNILRICGRTAAVEGIEELALTTNGILLPELAAELREAGVSRVNISLDSLRPDRYAWITRTGRLEDALRGIDAALQAGFAKVKINCVLIGGFNDDEIPDLARLTLRMPVDVRFIELMPMPGTGDFGPEAYLPVSAVRDRLLEAELLPDSEGVSSLMRLPGALGRIGLISPVSCSFCDECNRLRLTADGYLKPCLHSREEILIRGMDREGMVTAMKEAIARKPRQHEPLSAAEKSHSARGMSRIGG